jgi:hypothetical protein
MCKPISHRTVVGEIWLEGANIEDGQKLGFVRALLNNGLIGVDPLSDVVRVFLEMVLEILVEDGLVALYYFCLVGIVLQFRVLPDCVGSWPCRTSPYRGIRCFACPIAPTTLQ